MPVPEQASLKRPSARTLVYNCLREWIEQGVLAPGEIIKDVEIAKRLSVSRTPVREALQLLEQVGAIETAPNYQTRVSDVRPSTARLVYPPLTALLVVAGETALPVLGAADIATLSEANERMLAAVKRGDLTASRDADEAFHGLFAQRAANPFLTSAIDALQIHVRRLEAIYFTRLQPGLDSYREHEAIIELVGKGDPAALGQAIRAHYDRAVGALIEQVTSAEGSGSDGKPSGRKPGGRAQSTASRAGRSKADGPARAGKATARTAARKTAAKRGPARRTAH